MRFLRIFLFILMCLKTSVGFSQSDWSAVQSNSKAVEKLQRQDFKGAERDLLGQVGQSQDHPELLYNLGLTYDGMGEKEKAASAYEQAQKAADQRRLQSLKYASQFNRAELDQREGKIDQALEGYLRALQENPNSIEAKTNIELLTQQQKQDQKQQKKDSDSKDSKDQKNKDKPQNSSSKDNKDSQKDDKDKNKKDDKDKKQSDENKDKNENKDVN